MPWQCTWWEETGRQANYLRRYSRQNEPCSSDPARYYHDARTRVGDSPVIRDREGYRRERPAEAYAGDPRWPAACDCGYSFTAEDRWQVFSDIYMLRPETGETLLWRELPVGAMERNWWMERIPRYRGPDGRCLQVKLPNCGEHGWWIIDGPSRRDGQEGPGWTRSGEPPLLVVTPSIVWGEPARYHGFLGSGTAPGPGWLSDPV